MTNIVVIGNTTGDPELRFTPSGKAVANLNIADNHRKKNPTTDQWDDDGATFYRCTLWDQMAEHVAETIQKGQRVIVTGRIRNREWEDREGNKRLSLEIDVDDIGPSLKYATAQVTRDFNRAQQGNGRQQPAADPWNPATAQQQPAQQPMQNNTRASRGSQGTPRQNPPTPQGGFDYDEPPF